MGIACCFSPPMCWKDVSLLAGSYKGITTGGVFVGIRRWRLWNRLRRESDFIRLRCVRRLGFAPKEHPARSAYVCTKFLPIDAIPARRNVDERWLLY